MEQNSKKIEKGFVTLRIRRVTQGLEFYLQSEKIEDFFSNGGRVSTSNIMGDGSQAYTYRIERLRVNDSTVAVFHKLAKEYQLFYDGFVNLSILRMKGLKEGVTVIVNGVYSLDTVNQFIQKAKEGLKLFYRQYLKPIDVELIISTREVD